MLPPCDCKMAQPLGTARQFLKPLTYPRTQQPPSQVSSGPT